MTNLIVGISCLRILASGSSLPLDLVPRYLGSKGDPLGQKWQN